MFKTKEEFKYEFSKRIIETYGRTVEESHITEKFLVLELMVRDYASVRLLFRMQMLIMEWIVNLFYLLCKEKQSKDKSWMKQESL